MQVSTCENQEWVVILYDKVDVHYSIFGCLYMCSVFVKMKALTI
jgi:hypothetical protein